MGAFRAFSPRATRGSAMSFPFLCHCKKNLLRGFERAAVPLAPPIFRRSTQGSL